MSKALILFAATYVLMLMLSKYRVYTALISGALFILTGMLPIGKILPSIDFGVILMLIGTMGLVMLFIESEMPALLAELIIERVPNVRWAAVALSLLSGAISAFVDNVATVLMVAPVALEICRRLNADPVPFVIGVAVSSNLQGAATLVGDTTAIMLGSALDMSFTDFFWFKGKPSVFFAVEIGAVIAAFILYWIFRNDKQAVPKNLEKTKVTDFVPSALLILTVVLLIFVSFIPNRPDEINGVISCVLLLAGLVYNVVKNRSFKSAAQVINGIDFETVGLLIGLFLIIGGISNMGVIDAAAEILAKTGEGHVFVMYTAVVFGSVIISAFIDNIPYSAAMIPVIASVSQKMGIDPTALYFGLICGATLGGNCTPVGAAANITGIAILRREGYAVKNSDFFKIGIPFTAAAIIPAYIFIWVFFGVR